MERTVFSGQKIVSCVRRQLLVVQHGCIDGAGPPMRSVNHSVRCSNAACVHRRDLALCAWHRIYFWAERNQ